MCGVYILFFYCWCWYCFVCFFCFVFRCVVVCCFCCGCIYEVCDGCLFGVELVVLLERGVVWGCGVLVLWVGVVMGSGGL